METSSLALSLFIHILATVIWIGGLFITVLLVYPEVRRVLEEKPELYRLLSRLRTRFYPISNLCVVALWVTGLFQMTADPQYDGFLKIDNLWSQVMLIKHVFVLLMIGCGVLLQYGIAPSLERISLLLEKQKGDPATWQRLRQREVQLTIVNCLLGMGVLACSAIVTAL